MRILIGAVIKMNGNPCFFCNWIQVAENFINKLFQCNLICSWNRFQIRHVKKGSHQLGKPCCLFLDHSEKLFVFNHFRFLLFLKNFQVGLQYCKGCPQLMSCICRKLFLCTKGIVQSGQHFIERAGQLCNFIL